MLKNAGRYAKFLVGTASAIVTALVPYYGGDKWFVTVTAVLGAALVYLVPNQGAPAVKPPPAP